MVFSRSLLLIAGVIAGTVMEVCRGGEGGRDVRRLEQELAELRERVNAQQQHLEQQSARQEERLAAVEKSVEAHEKRLEEVPSTAQIVSAMEELLSRTMAGLDSRLSSQARSIEVLKTTVTQTDELLERVLESLDSLRPRAAEEPPPAGMASQS